MAFYKLIDIGEASEQNEVVKPVVKLFNNDVIGSGINGDSVGVNNSSIDYTAFDFVDLSSFGGDSETKISSDAELIEALANLGVTVKVENAYIVIENWDQNDSQKFGEIRDVYAGEIEENIPSLPTFNIEVQAGVPMETFNLAVEGNICHSGCNTEFFIDVSPLNGSASLSSDGELFYVESNDFFGTDKIEYKIRCSGGICDDRVYGPGIINIEVVGQITDPDPLAPIASFTVNSYTGVAPFTANFDASASSDPDGGSIVSYAWDFGDNNTGNGLTPSHTYSTPGTYDVTLTVTDNNGLTNIAQATLTVEATPNVAPTASFTPSVVSGTVPLLVSFDASGSSDSDGTIDSYAWDFGNGSNGSGETIDHTYNAAGTYTVTLVVTDNDGATDTATVEIEVTVANVDPVAAFTFSPSGGHLPHTVLFDASGSTDSDGTIASYAWDFGDGNNGTGETPTHTYNVAGTYTISLTVTDDDGATDTVTDTITIEPANVAPVADFSMSPIGGNSPLLVNFDASASTDSDGTIASYAWDFGDGNSDTGETVSHTYNTPGTYTVSLTVTDDDGATHSTTKNITVSAPNVLPIASFSATPTSGDAPLTVAFDGSGSTDSDGTIVSYDWDFGDGNTGTGATPNHDYVTAGTYTASLTVTDNNGGTDTTTIQITAIVPNASPLASFTFSPTNGKAPLAVTFDASGSSDSDGTIASYAWDFGDGNNDTGVNPTHTYTTGGTYTITLVVTDNDGATSQATQDITVSPVNVAPTASFTATPTTGDFPLEVVFDASGSSDPDGTIASYAWDFGDTNSDTGVNPTHTYSAAGTYTVTLTVTDNDGATDTATFNVVVTTPNVAPVASFTATPDNGNAPLSVVFDASGSSDSDGSIASYSWDFGDGNSDTGVNPTHNYTTAGTYTVTLTVTDDDGATHQATDTIEVNALPVASFTFSPSGGTAPLAVDFDATGSSDSDGSIASYAWDFGDGNSDTGATPSHTYTVNGTYTITLTVTDNDGATHQATDTIVVAVNNAPSASFEATPSAGNVPLLALFDATESSDSDGSISSYDWDFGDGNTGTGLSTSHTYTVAGTYTVTLTVTDNLGATDTATFTVTALGNTPASVETADLLHTMSATPSDAGFPLSITNYRFLNCGSPSEDGPNAATETNTRQESFSLNAYIEYNKSNNQRFAGEVSAVTHTNGEIGNTGPISNSSAVYTTDNGGSAWTLMCSGSYSAQRAEIGWTNSDVTPLGIVDGATFWVGWSFLYTEMDDAELSTVFQMRSQCASGSPRTQINVRPKDVYFSGNLNGLTLSTGLENGSGVGTAYSSGDRSNKNLIPKDVLKENQWYDIVLEIKLSQTANGFVRAWVAPAGTNSASSLDYGNPTAEILDAITAFDSCPHLRFGLYRHDSSPNTPSEIDPSNWVMEKHVANIRLKVGASLGSAGFDAVLPKVKTTPPNVAPTASFTATPSSGTVPLTVNFDGTGSSDSDGSIASYAWDFGDGNSDTGGTPSHTYTATGTYTVTLTVTDDDGATDVTTSSVVVSAAASPPISTLTYQYNFDTVASGLTQQRGVFELDLRMKASDGTTPLSTGDAFEITVTGSNTFTETLTGVIGDTWADLTTNAGADSIKNHILDDGAIGDNTQFHFAKKAWAVATSRRGNLVAEELTIGLVVTDGGVDSASSDITIPIYGVTGFDNTCADALETASQTSPILGGGMREVNPLPSGGAKYANSSWVFGNASSGEYELLNNPGSDNVTSNTRRVYVYLNGSTTATPGSPSTAQTGGASWLRNKNAKGFPAQVLDATDDIYKTLIGVQGDYVTSWQVDGDSGGAWARNGFERPDSFWTAGTEIENAIMMMSEDFPIDELITDVVIEVTAGTDLGAQLHIVLEEFPNYRY